MRGDPLEPSDAWRAWRAQVDLDEYDGRWARLEAQGAAVHGEADFVAALGGERILDAGCGTGRVAVELARRGRTVVGVDNDADMLARARLKPEPVRWELADLASLDLDDRFDIVVLAGNVLPYVAAEGRAAAVAGVAAHLRPGGLLVIGASPTPGCEAAVVDAWCTAAGLTLVEQFGTWERAPYRSGGYRVSIHTAG